MAEETNKSQTDGAFRDTSTLFPSMSTVKERQERAIQIAMQFLSEHGYQSSLQMLEEESGIEYNPESLPEASLYIRALDLLEDAHIASKADQSSLERKQIEEALIKGAGKDAKFASKQVNILEQVHSSNIIAARYSSDPSSDLVFSGGADRSLRITNSKTKELVAKYDYAFSAPILSIDVNPVRPELLVLSCMNGSHYVVNHTQTENPVLQKFHEHKKYVVRIKWNPTGTHFITACHDNTIRVYGPKAENEWECIKDFTFVNNVECVEFLQQTTYFVVAVREDNYLHVFDLATLKSAGKYNMNANGDDHVSFTAMELSSSHDGKLLQVATDRHRVILFRALSSAQVRNLYGAVNDNYSNPRTAWSLSDKHVYCSSQQDFSVVCWDIGTQKTVSTLLGHGKIVRDLHHHPSREEVLTASFDQSLRMWGPVLAE